MRMRIAVFLGFVFFVVGVITLPSYGINWDTINHLPRGQAYLHYFLTGNRDYSDLPKLFSTLKNPDEWYWQDPDSLAIKSNLPNQDIPTRSMYQLDAVDFNYFMERDGGGHPPLSDILSSIFNRVLFGELRVINDIDSYRVYGIFLVSLLIILIYVWLSKEYGSISGFIAVLALSTYPLFWSESHFNTEKDIPESVYWAFLFYSIWKGITQRSIKWILISGVFFGLALGTKFNILFSVFAIIPWVIYYWFLRYFSKKKNITKFIKENIKIIIFSLIAVLIGIAIFIGSWPYLWPDPIGRISTVTAFYKEIGTTTTFDSRYIVFKGVNIYPLFAIMYTTPLVTLFLFIIGVGIVISKIKKEESALSLLILLWFIVPVARVTWPGSNIYGGLRQIMEYIPALAMIAGIGGQSLFDYAGKKISLLTKPVVKILISILIFLPIFFKLASIHPHENVYFNPLIGGLSGAKEKDFPFWGNTFGGAYRKGVSFINKNAEEGAQLSYAYELIPNIPRIFLRGDINFSNGFRSGYLQQGEYAITLTYQGTKERSYYDSYLETFVKPIYIEEVDGVPVMKVWKNSPEFYISHGDEKEDNDVTVLKSDKGFKIDLGEVRAISRVEINYDEKNCLPLLTGVVSISKDNNIWNQVPGILPEFWRISSMGEQPKNGSFIEPFLGQEAQFVDFSLNPGDTCLTKIKTTKVFYFE